MIAFLLAAVLTFCPVTSDHFVIGYQCKAFAFDPAFTDTTPCDWCRCDVGNSIFPHPAPVELTCTIEQPAGLTAPGILTVADTPAGWVTEFRVSTIWDPNIGSCSPCACLDIWWTPSLDLTEPCVCPNGEC